MITVKSIVYPAWDDPIKISYTAGDETHLRQEQTLKCMEAPRPEMAVAFDALNKYFALYAGIPMKEETEDEEEKSSIHLTSITVKSNKKGVLVKFAGVKFSPLIC